jgi:uncharacterized protein YjiS (DUF1127 family)
MNASTLQQLPFGPPRDGRSPAASFGRIARSTALLQPPAGTAMARSANDTDVVPQEAASAAVMLRSVAARVRQLIAAWRRRRDAYATFRSLQAVDARTLRDIGIDASEVRSIAAELSGAASATRRHVAPARGL